MSFNIQGRQLQLMQLPSRMDLYLIYKVCLITKDRRNQSPLQDLHRPLMGHR